MSKYDEIGARFPGSGAAADAMWEAASCYKSMGDAAKARELYLALESVGGYRQRAEQELAVDGVNSNLNNVQGQVASRAAAAGAKMPAAAAPMPAPAPPAATAVEAKAQTKPSSGSTGSSRNAVSAPKKAPADTNVGF